MAAGDLTFERALELLGIADVASVRADDLLRLARSARSRWHPDTVAHRNDAALTARYTRQFQSIEPAVALVRAFIDGSLRTGAPRSTPRDASTVAPEDVIRTEAVRIQAHLGMSWERIKRTRFKYSQETVTVSDGFRVRELLDQDFKDDIAALSMIAFAYGAVVFGLATALLGAIAPVLGIVSGAFAFAQAIACIAGMLPLSRFWLPSHVQGPVLWLVNLGLKIYNFASREVGWSDDRFWLQLLVQWPMIVAWFVKYVVLWPSYELAKLLVGDKVVGVATKTVNYYGGFAEWYVDDLLRKAPAAMSRDELLDLGSLYARLGDVAPRAPAV